jgi:hypothetical protein
MKLMKTTILSGILLSACCGSAGAAVLYSYLNPITVSDNNAYSLPGLSLSRGASDSGTLYFRYTVTNPASNNTTELYYAGMSFYDLGNEHLGVGNGWDAYAYSAFGTANVDLNSANPEQNVTYQEVRSTDTTTIVIRVDFNSGANDNITVWLNPNLSVSEAAQNAALTTYFTANADFDTIYLREGGNAGDGWTFSNFGIAETFSEIAAIPEPSAALIGGLGMLCLVRRRR